MTTLEQYGEVEYTRGRDFFDPLLHSTSEATIVGCGGIGSFTAHALAKLGIAKLNLVDFDIVEAHNVPNQLYTMEHVGRPKVEALAEQVLSTSNATVSWRQGMITEDNGLVDEYGAQVPLGSGVVISALDSMEARAWLWQLVRMRMATSLFLDGRLGGQNIVVYAANTCSLPDIKGYEATLHSDEEGLDQPCTGRNIIDVGYAMAAIMARQVRQHYAGEDLPAITFQDQEALTLGTSGWLL